MRRRVQEKFVNGKHFIRYSLRAVTRRGAQPIRSRLDVWSRRAPNQWLRPQQRLAQEAANEQQASRRRVRSGSL